MGAFLSDGWASEKALDDIMGSLVNVIRPSVFANWHYQS